MLVMQQAAQSGAWLSWMTAAPHPQQRLCAVWHAWRSRGWPPPQPRLQMGQCATSIKSMSSSTQNHASPMPSAGKLTDWCAGAVPALPWPSDRRGPVLRLRNHRHGDSMASRLPAVCPATLALHANSEAGLKPGSWPRGRAGLQMCAGLLPPSPTLTCHQQRAWYKAGQAPPRAPQPPPAPHRGWTPEHAARSVAQVWLGRPMQTQRPYIASLLPKPACASGWGRLPRSPLARWLEGGLLACRPLGAPGWLCLDV
jgi:hypothetical protein